jgi:hypothetical protein
VPAGDLVALVAMLTCLGLLAMRPWAETRQLLVVLALGLAVWAVRTSVVRRGGGKAGEAPRGTP